MSTVKTLTSGQLFVPLAVQPSPLLPDTDMLLLLRNIERLDKLKLDSESILDDKRLARQFVARSFKVGRSLACEEMRQIIEDELR